MVLENNVVLIISQHDAQLDYYGKRLATCSSDRTVKVFDVVDGEPQRSTGGHTLKGCAHAVSGLLLGELMDCKKKTVTLDPCGKLPGLIRNTDISWHRVRMMERF